MDQQIKEVGIQPTEYMAVIPGLDIELEINIQYPKGHHDRKRQACEEHR